jgi:hypothetical protein
MAEIYWLTVHEWATPDNTFNAGSLALADCRIRDAALSKRAVEPDSADSALSTLANEVDRDVRVGGDNNAVDDGRRDGAKVWVAPGAFDF